MINLLQEHLAGMRAESPPECVFELDLGGLRQPEITFLTAWRQAVDATRVWAVCGIPRGSVLSVYGVWLWMQPKQTLFHMNYPRVITPDVHQLREHYKTVGILVRIAIPALFLVNEFLFSQAIGDI